MTSSDAVPAGAQRPDEGPRSTLQGTLPLVTLVALLVALAGGS